MLEYIVPVSTSVAEALADAQPFELFDAEWRAVRHCDEPRQREFATVRRCARDALKRLGVGPVPLVPGRRGEPIWPPGLVGSMTHCPGYRAAAVARDSAIGTLGIDAEPHAGLPRSAFARFSTEEERARLTGLGSAVHWDRLLFCAKEAVYKACSPWLGVQFALTDILVSLDVATERFRAELLVRGPVISGREMTLLEGRWLVRDGLIITAVAVECQV